MQELNNLIDKYLEVGNNFLSSFFKEKNIKPPESTMVWVCTRIEQHGILSDGTKYFKHGYGIDFSNIFFKISIDFGKQGEGDGFDAFRLFSFIEDNNIDSIFKNEEEIEKELKQGIEVGILEKRGSLYFRIK